MSPKTILIQSETIGKDEVVVLIGFIFYEGSRLNMKWFWMPIVGTGVVGVSLGLPLFLLLREIQLSKPANF